MPSNDMPRDQQWCAEHGVAWTPTWPRDRGQDYDYYGHVWVHEHAAGGAFVSWHPLPLDVLASAATRREDGATAEQRNSGTRKRKARRERGTEAGRDGE